MRPYDLEGFEVETPSVQQSGITVACRNCISHSMHFIEISSALYLCACVLSCQEYDELAETQGKLEEKLQELEANPPR